MHDPFQTFSATGRVRACEKMYPKERNGFVIFFRFASDRGESTQCLAHLIGGLPRR
jgi:hypothetical protein